MLPKLSVKKPLTVFVSVIIILMLGFVSFTKITPDLLPSIEELDSVNESNLYSFYKKLFSSLYKLFV